MELSEDFRESRRWSVERDANVLEHGRCADLPRDPLFRLDVRKHEDGWATSSSWTRLKASLPA